MVNPVFGVGGGYVNPYSQALKIISNDTTQASSTMNRMNTRIGGVAFDYGNEPVPICAAHLLIVHPGLIHFTFPYAYQVNVDEEQAMTEHVKTKPVGRPESFTKPRRFRQGKYTRYAKMLAKEAKWFENANVETIHQRMQQFSRRLHAEHNFLGILLAESDKCNPLSLYVKAEHQVQQAIILCLYLNKFTFPEERGFSFVLCDRKLKQRLRSVKNFYDWFVCQCSDYIGLEPLEADFEFVLRNYTIEAVDLAIELLKVDAMVRSEQQFEDAKNKLHSLVAALRDSVNEVWLQRLNERVKKINTRALRDACRQCYSYKDYAEKIFAHFYDVNYDDDKTRDKTALPAPVVNEPVLNLLMPCPWFKAALNKNNAERVFERLTDFFQPLNFKDHYDLNKKLLLNFDDNEDVSAPKIIVTHPQTTPASIKLVLNYLGSDAITQQAFVQAVKYNKVSLVESLRTEYALRFSELNCATTFNYEVVDEASFKDNQLILTWILEQFHQEHYQDVDMSRLFSVAFFNQDETSLAMLLESYNGEEPITHAINDSSNGWPFLHWAVHALNVEVVRLLVEYGVDIYQKDENGCTARELLVRFEQDHEAVQQIYQLLPAKKSGLWF